MVAVSTEDEVKLMQHSPQSNAALTQNADKEQPRHALPKYVQPDLRNHSIDETEHESELQRQRQQQEVVTAAMQAMGALPPNAVFKVASVFTCRSVFITYQR